MLDLPRSEVPTWGRMARGENIDYVPFKKPVISELKAVVVLELEQLWIHNWGRADDSSTFHMT